MRIVSSKLNLEITYYFNLKSISVRIEEYIDEIDIYIADEYFSGAYDSCKHVIYPSTGQLALDLMCGEYGAAKCSPARWFGSMGDSNNPFVPFQINYLPQNSSNLDDEIKPLNPKVVPCNQPVDRYDVRMFWHFLEIHSTLTQNFYSMLLFNIGEREVAAMFMCRLSIVMPETSKTRTHSTEICYLGLGWICCDYVFHLLIRKFNIYNGCRMLLNIRIG